MQRKSRVDACSQTATSIRADRLAVEHAAERFHATRVEFRAGFFPQERDRTLVHPRLAVDAVGAKRVVDVADGEHARLEREDGGAVRVAGAVQPLVVVAHEAPDAGRETEPAEERVAPDRVLLDERVLGIVERGRLLQHLVGDGELADVVQQASRRELAQTRGRQRELLPHLDRQQCHPARVALGVFVLRGELPHETTDLGAEERLLGRDELGAAQVAGERAGGRGTEQVRRDGAPTRSTPATSRP